jgi:hypothetical protein
VLRLGIEFDDCVSGGLTGEGKPKKVRYREVQGLLPAEIVFIAHWYLDWFQSV